MIFNISKNNWTNWHHKFHQQFLNDKEFIPNGANLLIAVSGGQDSMALISLINDIKNHHNWKINVWHGDHQWHKDSSKFANKLELYCKGKGIPFFINVADAKKVNSEKKARDWRYEKLCNKVDELLVKEKSIYNWYILTGHTSTDNTETFLLNLARGSNYNGLAGIPKQRLLNNKYFLRRPILIFNRKETISICKMLNVPFWEDPTNLDLSIKRNLIRHKVLPFLNKIHPGYTNGINQFVGKMDNYSKEQADLCKLAIEACKNSDGFKREVLNTLGLEARCTIINAIIKQKCLKQISSKNIETISFEILKKSNGQIKLPEGLKIVWNKNTIRLES